MMDFRKDLAHQLIEYKYLVQEIMSDHHQSVRIWQGISHGLLSLPPFKFFEWTDGQFQVMLPSEKMQLLLKRSAVLLQVFSRKLFV